MKPGGAGLNQIGRFLSPDPYVQVPEYSQNFNRYSYVMNNPLNSTDPSGFSWVSDAFGKVGSWLKQNWRTVVSIVFAAVVTYLTAGFGATFATGFLNGAATGAFNSAINGGDSSEILRGAAVSALQGGVSSGVLHNMEPSSYGFSGQMAAHVVGHGVVGGAANAAMGGKFQDGFISAAAGAAAGDLGAYSFIEGDGLGARAGRTMVAGIIGGTVAEIGGGKFANGAWTSAFQHLLNEEFRRTHDIEGEFDSQAGKLKLRIFTENGMIEYVVDAKSGGHFTGDGNFEPNSNVSIPKGDYYLVPDPNANVRPASKGTWFGLYKKDGRIDDYDTPHDGIAPRIIIDKGWNKKIPVGRGLFRIHKGEWSSGCLTICKFYYKAKTYYDAVVAPAIKNTRLASVPLYGGNPHGQKVMVYGIMSVR